MVENNTNIIKKYPYKTPNYKVLNDSTLIETPDGWMPLEIFGKHNLQNMAGAKWICQHIGIGEDAFYEAIASFKGASKRLEKIAESQTAVAFKDFAHSPSKVKATTAAVAEMYHEKKVLACLELHTYSSLNKKFLSHYKNTLGKADKAVVFYSPHALAIKKMEPISEVAIKEAFGKEDLMVFTEPKAFKDFLFEEDLKNTALLLMSSGNYGGLDFDAIKTLLT